MNGNERDLGVILNVNLKPDVLRLVKSQHVLTRCSHRLLFTDPECDLRIRGHCVCDVHRPLAQIWSRLSICITQRCVCVCVSVWYGYCLLVLRPSNV